MEAFISVVVLSGLMIWAMSAVPYALLIVLVNLVYRTSRGRFFRWFSKATVLPFLLLLLVSMGVAYAAWSTYPGPK